MTAVPADLSCPPTAIAATYSYSGSVQTSATDATQRTTLFELGASSFSAYHAGSSVPYVTNSYMLVGGTGDRDKLKVVTAQQFADGRQVDYDWDIVTNTLTDGRTTQFIGGGTWDDDNGDRVTSVNGRYRHFSYNDPYHNILYPTPGPETVTDQNGQVYRYSYCSGNWGDFCDKASLDSTQKPEGNGREFTYDSYWRIVAVENHPKPNSGLPPNTVLTSYGTSCETSPKTCNQPVTTTDAKGNVTNFSYDPTHGGILKRTGPADASGVRPETRYAYAQKYAWVRSGGGWVQAATPVWVPVSEEMCRTSAADAAGNCAAGALDEVVTTYEYEQGSASKGSNLLVKGVAVTGLNAQTGQLQTLRTCYGYDEYGRRTSERKPAAGLGACP